MGGVIVVVSVVGLKIGPGQNNKAGNFPPSLSLVLPGPLGTRILVLFLRIPATASSLLLSLHLRYLIFSQLALTLKAASASMYSQREF